MANPVGPVIYDIQVDGKTVLDFPLDTELRQCWGRHDMFFVRIEIPRNTSVDKLKIWRQNAPVKIIFGRRPADMHTWFGYVNHHNISENADSGSHALQITYVCIGTSKPMNTDKSRTWGSVSPTYMARKIAHEHGFRAILTSTNWVLPHEVQANESDFCFLNRIAEKVGYRFWVSGSTLFFIDPAVILMGTSKQAVPVFRMDKLFTQLDTLREFSLNQGDNIPGSVIAKRSVYGLNQATGQPFRLFANTDQSPIIEHVKSDMFVPDINYAQQHIQAWQNLNQFWLCASGELYGNTLIYPGKLVSLAGKQLPTDAQGHWIVSAACHVLKKSGSTYAPADKYVTQVELIKNTSASLPKIKHVHPISPEFVDCRLFKGTWLSQNTTVSYDGVLKV